LEDCVLRQFIALVTELFDQGRRKEVSVLGGMHFCLVDWKKHRLDPLLGVTERAFMLHYLYLERIQFAIDGLGHSTQVSGLLMAFQPVPDLGIKGVPEGFTKGDVILLGFSICRQSGPGEVGTPSRPGTFL